MNRIDRLLGYLLVFQSHAPVRARDLATHFAVSERTVYRDIEALYEVGMPLVGMPGEGYQLMPGYYLPPVMFSEDEAKALFLAIAMLTGLTVPGPTRDAANHALDKIRVIYHAQHDNQVAQRAVEPLQLAYLDNVWVLSAFCRLRQEQRAFRLDRIARLRFTHETFTPRPVRQQREAAGQEITIRVDRDAARWVWESQLFAFLSETVTENGDALMHYRLHDIGKFTTWLLQWGEYAEVVTPHAVRQQMARRVYAMATRYRDPELKAHQVES